MKRFSILTLLLMITLVISGCGGRAPQATPPAVDAADLQGTIAAAAFTVIAETQAAIPTATPPPPTATSTETPLPTNTFLPLPPSGVTLTTAPGASSGSEDPCIYKTLPASLTGEPVKMRIDNSTKATLSVSVYLNQASPQGQCGYRAYTLAPGESVVINNLVEGCYTLWAWNPVPEEYFIVTNGTSCIDSASNSIFDISTSSIKLKV